MSALAKWGPRVARTILGLEFFVFGLNGFLNFLPKPDHVDPRAAAFGGAMMASGYFFPLVKATEVVSGGLLLSGKFTPLALVALVPIVVNILAFHLFLEPSGTPIAVITLLLEAYLGWAYRGAFRGVLAANVAPTVASENAEAPARQAAVSHA